MVKFRYAFLGALFLIALSSRAMDAPGEFVQNSSGNLALSGLSGFYSTPAREAIPSYGLVFARELSTGLFVAGGAGEIALGSSAYPFRLAFMESYLEMDSVYRQVYSQVETSVALSWLVMGLGYGASVEWIPAEQHWTRHRYKAGSSLVWKDLSLSVMVAGWVGDISSLSYGVGGQFWAKKRISAFVEYDGTSFDVGNVVRFRFCDLFAAYRFPGFAMSLKVELHLMGWNIHGMYGFAGSFWRWLGSGFSRDLR